MAENDTQLWYNKSCYYGWRIDFDIWFVCIYYILLLVLGNAFIYKAWFYHISINMAIMQYITMLDEANSVAIYT